MILQRYKSTLMGLIGALLLMGCQNSDTRGQVNDTANQNEAKVVITEYSDFQCPACAYFYPIVEKLKKNYGSDLEVKYRHFPLNSHQYAMLAARATEAARNQGEFEAMHDKLFENQEQWSKASNPQSVIVGYAKQIGLDIGQFKEDLNASETQREVMEQKKSGENRGVNSTPTFYINGEEVVSLPRTYEQFKALVDLYMKEAGGSSN